MSSLTDTSDRRFEPGKALFVLSVLLPAAVFLLAAWQGRREAIRETTGRVERTARILREHAVKVFETNRLVIEQVNERLRASNLSRETDRLALFQLMKRLQDDLEQVATISVTDGAGRMRATSRAYPFDTSLSYADRDWFKALAAANPKLPFVSTSYSGRQSGIRIFNIAARATDGDPDAFAGAVAVSVDRPYFEDFYKGVEPTFESVTVLAREDGAILARYPNDDRDQLGPDSPFMAHARESPRGVFMARGTRNGEMRIFGYEKVGDYPVYVGFGITERSALEPWREDLMRYGIVATIAALALIGLSALAVREQREQSRATARWRQAAADLQREAATRLKAEEQLRQAQKMEAVGRLTGGLAHDFNNILTVVIGNLDLLKRRAPEDDRLRRLIDKAADGATRAAALTHRLLAFSRDQPLAPATLDVNALVAGMSDLLARTLGEDVAVALSLAQDAPATLADANQFESAILNLAVNARDAMGEGGRLTIETRRIEIGAAEAARMEMAPGSCVEVSVADTGAGMDAAALRRAFEPFFTTKPFGRGTGLGLAQVWGFAKQSRGHATIDSAPGRGTRVAIVLPAQDAPPTSAAPPAPAMRVAPRGEGRTVLVVEDDDALRDFSVACLRELGFDVMEAADGPTAVARLAGGDPIALLFTDIVLKGPMNGRQVAAQARRLRPDLPVLYTTGYADGAFAKEPQDSAPLLPKPFTMAELAANAHAALAAAAG